MKPRIALWVAVPVLVAMVGFIGVLATSDSAGTRQTQSPLLGRQAPELAGTTIAGGSFDIADHRGEYVLVNFFATWCVPCIREHPELIAFHDEHSATGQASVVSVVYDSRVSGVQEFFATHGGDWPVVTDPDGRVALDYGVAGVPESYLVGPDGTVVTKLIGGVTAPGLNDVLAQARGLAAPAGDGG